MMDARFDHTQWEEKLYQQWESTDVFKPMNIKKGGKTNPFSIIMPPPNANDPLHIGHALFVSIEDILTRFHRMLGDNTLWLPGTDHAGIETQFVYEKKLQKQKKSRFDFDRETLYTQIWNYVQENSDVAVSQIKRLGASADWSRFTFTLDPKVVTFVTDTFKKLAADGLVYRDLRLVHYCVHCGTSFSELEVNHVEQTTNLYYVKYRFVDNPAEYVVLATTRPEPIWVDTHLAVHPDNPKTKHLIGKQVLNPLTDAVMEIIADEFVDPAFGTGVVKLTPAHDFADFAVAKKHNLPIMSAIDRRGKLVAAAGAYAGLSVTAARTAIVSDLEKNGLIEKIDTKYQNRIGTCYRCGRVLEQLPLPQFFVAVNKPGKSLTQAALKALDTNETVIYGAGREKILRHWLEQLQDWNISRQIVWGIRIPVWYAVRGHESEITVSFITPDGTFTQGTLAEVLTTHTLQEVEAGLQQLSADNTVPYTISVERPQDETLYLPETDTFDTWFSSAQWPVVTLKTNHPDDFDTFYPTTVMETGYDILPFWVMRMMLMGIYLTGKSPFSEVYLHGLVRDAKGQKMSKSKGNVINPLEIVDKYGADALRMALVIRSTPGQDKSLGEQDFRAMRNFSNKLWNAARFIALQDKNTNNFTNSEPRILDNGKSNKLNITFKVNNINTKDLDTTFNTKLLFTVTEVTTNLRERKIGLAADTLYDEFWHWFCDECIEKQKKDELSLGALRAGLEIFLKLLHPFMPYVTEAIWQEIGTKGDNSPTLLATTSWPKNS